MKENLNLEMSKLSRIRNSILEEEWLGRENGEIVRWNSVMSGGCETGG